MQSLNQLVNLLKPPEVFSWQTMILAGALSWVLSLAAIYTEAESATVDLLVMISWLLTTVGGSWLVYTLIKPPRYFSWQTTVLLGFFSWLTSLLAAVIEASIFTRNLLGVFSWLFFTIGVGWALNKHPVKLSGVSIGPWITGAIFSIFLFGVLPGDSIAPAVVSWPIVSVLIAATPHFVNWNLSLKTPPVSIRQDLILLLLLNLLFTSWLEFYFLIQNWLDDYPSLIVDDFSRSGFVYVLPRSLWVSPGDEPFSRGEILLDSAGLIVKNTLDGRPWPSLERWLLNVDEQIAPIEDEARQGLMAEAEREFWALRADTPPGEFGGDSSSYDLTLQAVWTGPASNPEGYYLEKTCRITQVFPPSENAAGDAASSPDQIVESSTPLANVDCELGTSPRRWGQPS